MSKITGIIAEFNPFHNGHKRLLDAADGTKIVVMSGNWMQRGEPAFVDKWIRAEMALANGADLVVELPLMSAVQGADFFAAGAMKILSDLGIDELLFGSENECDYQKISEIYTEKSEEMETYLKNLPSNLSYPVRAQMMWEKFAAVKFDGKTPNHVLGLAYAKAANGIKLRAITRNTAYNSAELIGNFASGTAIRENLAKSQNFVPENCWQILQNAPKTNWSDFWELLKYKITLGNLTAIYQVNDELSNRISKAIKISENLTELIDNVHTKRYTKGFVRRLMVYILLDIPREFQLPEKIHVLGFSEKGQEILAQNRDKIITKIGQNPWDNLTQKADKIYQLSNLTEQNYGRKPIMKKNAD